MELKSSTTNTKLPTPTGGGAKKDNNNQDTKTPTNGGTTTIITPNNKQPLVARISLWTTRSNNIKLTKNSSHHDNSSGSNSNDSSNDDDDDDESQDEAEGFDMDLDENAQLEQKLKQANLPEYVRRVTSKEIQKLRRTPSFMSDYAITRGYLELIAELPWNESTVERIDLKKCRQDLDNDHYGMQKLKERVLQYLAVKKLKLQVSSNGGSVRAPLKSSSSSQTTTSRSTSSSSSQPILMFVGPPGTGKTSIAQSIANSLGRKFYRISLGGVADQSAIRGHRRTYIGAMPGRIIQGIKQVRVNNPVFLLDEIDKLSPGSQGDPSGALLEVLDPEQNHTFTDHYLNLPFDLSRVLFIATANSLENIPAALLDRMEVIQIAGYTHDEKFNIARKHLVPKQVMDNGLRSNMIVFKDDAIHKIIANYAREAGVRTLERRLAAVCRVVAVKTVEDQQQQQQPSLQQQESSSSSSSTIMIKGQPVIVDANSLETFLGPVVFEKESRALANVPGVAIGLAWTATGGEITFVETEIMKGLKREGLVLTGQLGSVMRESAMLALNWIRANFHLYDSLPQTLGRDLVENTVHIHFPAGGVGKDGPSAGVTIVVSLLSLCSGISVIPDLAMTGEITLRGVVLKVGGVKSKILAAHRGGIKQVILPARNETDLNEISSSIKEKMRFHFVSTIDEVIRIAFDGKLAFNGNLLDRSLNVIDPNRGLTSKL